ncbi:MAG: glycosyltransferase family 2 protein [Shimia sp.]
MSQPRTAIISCMRNEGQFLLEWVAHHRECGFDEIVVLTNDCDDGTDAMLDRLTTLGEVTHIPNPVHPGTAPQEAGTRRALAHPTILGCDWVLHIDADEFLRVDHGDGTIQDLLAAMPGHADAIAIFWKPFGQNGLTDWPGGNVTELNLMTQETPDPGSFHKTLFRPNKFPRATDHMPKDPYGPVTLRNASGQEMNPVAMTKDFAKYRRNDPALMNWDGAAIHHYAIRADDVFMMKNARGDGQALNNTKYFAGSGFYNRFNKNEVEDRGIHRHRIAMQARKARYLADPELGRLHHAAEAWFQDLKARVLTPEQRAAWSK